MNEWVGYGVGQLGSRDVPGTIFYRVPSIKNGFLPGPGTEYLTN